MQVLAHIVLWGSVLALAHTYVFYPLFMRWLARGKKSNTEVFEPNDPDLPVVAVLMSVYNEERVIAEKLDSLRNLNYPAEKLCIYIGSDCSDDRTAAIIAEQQPQFPVYRFQFFDFPERRGKPPVINELARRALDDFQRREPSARKDFLFLLTDASVMLEPDTLYRLVRHFKNPAIGVVDAHMRSAGVRTEGISRSEEQYLSGEVLLKHREGLAWGMMIGPFGGCYAMRAGIFEPVPPQSLVDDFWLVFRVLEKGYQAINDLDAVCHEGATHRVADEYRRKKRIAAGSFQNLVRFRRWVLPPVTRLGFAFFSHKVLRWFGGFFLLAAYLALGVLACSSAFFQQLFGLLTATGGTVLLWNYLQQKWRLKPVKLIKNAVYFFAMNVALMDGFFKWIRGILENTWQRTRRE